LEWRSAVSVGLVLGRTTRTHGGESEGSKGGKVVIGAQSGRDGKERAVRKQDCGPRDGIYMVGRAKRPLRSNIRQ
jgi:hypothetical protein